MSVQSPCAQQKGGVCPPPVLSERPALQPAPTPGSLHELLPSLHGHTIPAFCLPFKTFLCSSLLSFMLELLHVSHLPIFGSANFYETDLLQLVRQVKDTVEERKRKHQHEAEGDLGTSSSPELFQSKGIIILIK